jgi:hypothetical protein
VSDGWFGFAEREFFMVICPRCAKLVDETVRATCPHCFTPLAGAAPLDGAAPQPGSPPAQYGAAQPPQYGAAQPPQYGAPPAQPYPGGAPPQSPPAQAPQLSRSGGTRVSLTGEVIDDATSTPPPSYVGGGAPSRSPAGVAARPGGLAASRSAYGAPRIEVPAKSGSGGKIAGVCLGILLLGGVGAGAWWFLQPHDTPKMVVEKFDTAIAAQDWKTVYTLVEIPADRKAKYADATAFANDMTTQMQALKANPMLGGFIDSAFKAYQTAEVGEGTITGDNATVPIKLKMSITLMGQTREQSVDQQIPLRKFGRTWKVDGMKGPWAGLGGKGGFPGAQ